MCVLTNLTYFRENFREKKYFEKILRHQNFITKMVFLIYMLLTSFAFFCKKRIEKSIFVDFGENAPTKTIV
jgi:hypothetical protein